MKTELINQLLWAFKALPESYVVLDTETTGLFDEQGAPGIVSLGLALDHRPCRTVSGNATVTRRCILFPAGGTTLGQRHGTQVL